MTLAEILALPAGAALDGAVHSQALGRRGRPKKYSTDIAAAFILIEQFPIFCGRVAQADKGYDPTRPFVAGSLSAVDGADRHYRSTTTVRASSMEVALCKAALIIAVQPKDQPKPRADIPRLGSRRAVPALDPMPERRLEPKLPTPIAGPEAEKK